MGKVINYIVWCGKFVVLSTWASTGRLIYLEQYVVLVLEAAIMVMVFVYLSAHNSALCGLFQSPDFKLVSNWMRLLFWTHNMKLITQKCPLEEFSIWPYLGPTLEIYTAATQILMMEYWYLFQQISRMLENYSNCGTLLFFSDYHVYLPEDNCTYIK